MKITYNEELQTYSIHDIKVGECFLNNEGDIYMKIACNNCAINNAISLKRGNMTYFRATEDVFPVEVELVVSKIKDNKVDF